MAAVFAAARGARKRVRETAARFGLAVNTQARVSELSVGERQRVEILKALYRGARVLILDEPTAVLTPQESRDLFATLRQLVTEGLSIIFISHKLDEVLAVSDRIAVLRNGRLVALREARGATKAELARADGRPGRRDADAQAPRAGSDDRSRCAACTSSDADGGALLDGIDLTVAAGEIVAIAGVAGNGQQALAGLLSGTLAPERGTVTLAGRALAAKPRAWIAARVGANSGGSARGRRDRRSRRLGERDLRTACGCRSSRARASFAAPRAARMPKRSCAGSTCALSGIDVPARSLSGGNMQKLILGRALTVGGGATPAFILADQPTWGLDIGALAYVHECLLDAAGAGAAVLLISEDLDEIFALADRIGVMYHGRLSAVRPAESWTLAAIGLAMAGGEEAARAA